MVRPRNTPDKSSHVFTMRIPNNLYKYVEDYCTKHNMTRIGMIHEALYQFLGLKKGVVKDLDIIQQLEERIMIIEHRLNTPILPVAPNTDTLASLKMLTLPNIDPEREYTTQELAVLGGWPLDKATLHIERNGFVFAGWDGQYNRWKLDPELKKA
jgi:hypothetical protein